MSVCTVFELSNIDTLPSINSSIMSHQKGEGRHGDAVFSMHRRLLARTWRSDGDFLPGVSCSHCLCVCVGA